MGSIFALSSDTSLCKDILYSIWPLVLTQEDSSTTNLLLVTTPEVPISVWRKLLFGDKEPTRKSWHRANKCKVKKKNAAQAEMNSQSKFSQWEAYLTTHKEKLRERALEKKKSSLLYILGGGFTFGLGESYGFTCSVYLYRLISREADHVCLTCSIKTLNLIVGSKEIPQSDCRIKNSTPTLNIEGIEHFMSMVIKWDSLL